MGTKPPPGYDFLGGKQDDITVTVAQIFKDKGENDPNRKIAEKDTHFKEQKHVYTEAPQHAEPEKPKTVDAVRKQLKDGASTAEKSQDEKNS